MTIIQGTCISFKVELLTATHDFTNGTGDTFMLALYDEDADLSEDTTAYTTTNEVVGSGYSAGGVVLTTVTPTSAGRVGLADFEDVTIATVTISPRGGLIYNSSKANRAVCVLDFGRIVSKTAEDLVVTFPDANAIDAIVRVR